MFVDNRKLINKLIHTWSRKIRRTFRFLDHNRILRPIEHRIRVITSATTWSRKAQTALNVAVIFLPPLLSCPLIWIGSSWPILLSVRHSKLDTNYKMCALLVFDTGFLTASQYEISILLRRSLRNLDSSPNLENYLQIWWQSNGSGTRRHSKKSRLIHYPSNCNMEKDTRTVSYFSAPLFCKQFSLQLMCKESRSKSAHKPILFFM
jgi:hypothetical protein